MMKKIIFSALIAVVVAGGAHAQDKQPHCKGFRHHAPYGMYQQLNLTDDQKASLKSLNEDYRKQMAELKKHEDITVKEWKSRMESIRKEHRSKVDQVFTPEQKTKMEQLKQDRQKKMKERGKKRMETMKKELNLTADQEAALKQQQEQMKAKLKSLREDKSLSEEQKKIEMKKFREQQHQSLKSILTEEQLNKLQQQRKHPRGDRKVKG